MATRRTLLGSAALAPMLAAPFGVTSRAATQGAVTVETDVSYGQVNGEELLLDISQPPAAQTPRPAVILIHGGGWTTASGGRLEMAEAAGKLAAAGYVAFNITYRLMEFFGREPEPNVWPAQLDDVQRAVRWVRAHAADYGVDPERIVAYGHDSGGHLAAMLGVRETRANSDPELADYSSRVNRVVALAGDMNLARSYPDESSELTVRTLLGGTAEEVPETYRDASPLAWVDAETVPFLLVHGGADEFIPVTHARTMVEALHEAEVDAAYVEFAGGNHASSGWWILSGPWVLAFLAGPLHSEL